MKRRILAYALAWILLAQAIVLAGPMPATITIVSTTVNPSTTYVGSTATLRIYSNITFTASDGSIVMAGTPGSGAFFKSVACTISSGVITIPAFTLPSTTDAMDNQTARYTAIFYDSRGVKRDTFLADFQLPLSLGVTQSWPQIRVYKAGFKPLPDTSTYTKTQTDAQILNATSGAVSDASDLVKGKTKLSVAPAVASNPIAVGINDPILTAQPDASVIVKGKTKLSVAPASPTDPIAVGVNDPVLIQPDASASVKGKSKLSVAPASPTDPIAVGINDPVLVQPDASTSVKGKTMLSVAPDSPTSPIAVGINDLRLPLITHPLCAGIDDTTALSLANTLGRTIVIQRGVTCAVSSFTFTVPMIIERGGLLKPLNGTTATLAGGFEAGDYQAFTNATGSGLGTIAMPVSVPVVSVGWFGPPNAVNSSAVISAAFDIAMQTISPSATLYVPSGRWVIGTTVTKNLATATKQSQFIIRGNGSSSQLVFGVANNQAGLTLQNGHKIVIRDLVFVGNGVPVAGNAPSWNVWRGLEFNGALQAVLDNVDFFGIDAGVTANGAVIYANNTNLALRHVGIRGCSASVGIQNPMIMVQNWRTFTVDNLEILDFGLVNHTNAPGGNIFYSVAGSNPSDGWLQLGNVVPATLNSYSGGYAYIKDVVTDEGTYFVMRTGTTDGSQIQSVVIDGWRANLSNNTDFVINNVKRFAMRNSKVAYSPGGHIENPFPVITLDNVDVAEVTSTEFLGPVDTIGIGLNVGYVRLEDSTYERVLNPNCTVVDEIVKGEKLPEVPCNAMAERSGAGMQRHYFNETTGKTVNSIDGHLPFALHGGKAPVPLSDSFTELTLDAAKWDSQSSANITTTQVNNRLQFTVANSAGADATPGKYTSDNTYDFSKNGIISVYLPTLPTTAATGTFKQTLYVMAADGVTPIYSMYHDSGNFGQIVMTDDTGSGGNPLSYGPYWRIRYENGTVYFEVSLNNSNWATMRSAASLATVTSVKFVLETWSINTPATVTVHPTFDEFRFSQHYPALISDDGVTLSFTSTFKDWLRAARCDNATPSTDWDLPTTAPAVPACVTGSNIQKGVLDFADTAGGFSTQASFLLPADWVSFVDVKLIWFTSATTGNVRWSLETATTATNGTELDDPAFATSFSVTSTVPGTANRLFTTDFLQATTPGAAASRMMHLRISRDGAHAGDTAGATVRLVGAELTYRRATTTTQ